MRNRFHTAGPGGVTLVVSLLAVLALVACGGTSPVSPSTGSSGSGTGGSQGTPLPPPTLTFVPEAPSSIVGQVVSLQPTTRLLENGKVVFGIWIHNMDRVFRFRGSVRWDRNLLDYDAWGEGDWFKQGGAIVNWSVTTSTPGQVSFSMDRPSTASAASGSGEVLVIRLKPKTAVSNGSTPLQWDQPVVSDSSGRSLGVDRAFGGTVTVTAPPAP